jgi:hypothetical protein
MAFIAWPALANNLLVGSNRGDGNSSTFDKYDDNGNFLLTGTLDVPRSNHTATKLQNGSIFVAGGFQDPTSWEILDQNGNVLHSGVLQDQRVAHAATLLSNGNVFLAGGNNTPGTWEIHNPTGGFVASGSLLDARTGGLRVLTLQNGNIWVSGSGMGSAAGAVYEIRNINGALVSSGSLLNNYSGGKALVLQSGNVMLLGGDTCTNCREIRTQTGGLVNSGSLVNAFNSGSTAVLLTNGNVFIFGSCVVSQCIASGSPATWEIRNASGGLVATGSLFDQRDGAPGVVVSTGNIFITGGNAASGTWEIRNASGALVSQGSLFNTHGSGHTDTHF